MAAAAAAAAAGTLLLLYRVYARARAAPPELDQDGRRVVRINLWSPPRCAR
jgi:hypothetical protein